MSESALPAPGPLFERLYEELKRIARRQLDGEPRTLETTGLVHEAWLKLGPAAVADEAHLLNLAARAMRQILVDAARRRAADKRGGGGLRVTLTGRIAQEPPTPPLDVLDVEQALERLERVEPRLARVVELHFYGGLEFAEIGRVLAVAERTVYRDWRAARALILADLAPGE